MTTTTRPAAVAGLFYPDDPEALTAMVDADLAEGAARLPRLPLSVETGGKGPKALVAPHAGYVYSGPVAGTAYAAVAERKGTVSRVVLLGPAHRVALRGMAVPSVDAFATPLGSVPVDDAARRAALDCRGVHLDDRPHAQEHALEVHLPFLQRVLGPDGWQVLPIVVGHATAEQVAAVVERLWGGPETLLVVSSDLSHYHDQATADRLDARTASAILAGAVDRIRPNDACGAHPLRGLLWAARRHGSKVTLLDLRSSADTAGEPDRVVGYGAFAVG
ncbi:AmmeMemoRadiSam system protein B [Rhabdothermincola salaria]|uniref:AmmeMemoRadiSam system protein B n=1 Tax=Rhabdothermincola salaria TaxID=2903142 RepID=UPI001E52B6D4|nr:AmmeMemoRadiSam system protein B [Rhabdothermincola salaria]MCD9625020.1 AmmeMemoRadiSam system protein B [Rhabdothermincola salaria]